MRRWKTCKTCKEEFSYDSRKSKKRTVCDECIKRGNEKQRKSSGGKISPLILLCNKKGGEKR